MRRRRAAVALAAGLALGGGAAVAVGLGDQDPAPGPVPVPGPARAEPTGPGAPEPSAAPGDRAATDGPAALPGPSSPAAPPSSSAEPRRVALPERVRVPAIGVDSGLLHLGLNDDGTIEVPAGDDIDSAAWYDGSPRPGEAGPSVIEGHVDSPDGPSVFARLAELEPGQKVHVDRRDGSTATFVVDRVEQYAKRDFPTREVYANTDGPELRLITCGGAWDPEWGHYLDNTVVYAHLA